jgi:ribosomal protein S18 acetylase RimI-like enzyme
MGIIVRQLTDIDYHKASNTLNYEDADAAFIEALVDIKKMYSIWNDNDLVGVAQLKEGKKAFVYVFIDKPYRCNGFGDMALILCEQILRDAGADTIMTNYRIDHDASRSFAKKHGYIRSFSSTYMKYNGDKFDIPFLSIREYNDEDYKSAHEMYARAFHEMRSRVGCFPDSVIEQPNEYMRRHWDSTKNERFVYVQDNEIIGYAHVVRNEIGSISIKSEFQGQGIGRMVMKFICNKIFEEGYKEVSLYCVVGNWAKLLYDSLGFIEIYTSEYALLSVC